MAAPQTPVVLELRELRKSFGKTEIVRGVSLKAHAGEKIAMIGPNGSGKSTLFNLISGLFAPSAGVVQLNGYPIEGKRPFEINRLGLSRSFQISNLFPGLSVFENLRCAVLWSMGYRYTFLRPLASLTDANRRAAKVMAQIRLDGRRGGWCQRWSGDVETGVRRRANPLDQPAPGVDHDVYEGRVVQVAVRVFPRRDPQPHDAGGRA